MARNATSLDASARTHHRIAGICARQCGQIAARQLHALGLRQPAIRARVRRGRLFEALPLVYSLSPLVTADGHRAAALLAIPGWAALSGWSAAELLGLADRPDGPHHVTTTGTRRSIPGRLVVHRTRLEIPVRRVRGFPVTEPGRVLLDLALEGPDQVLEQAVAVALDRRMLTEQMVLDLPARYPGHRGAAGLRAIDPALARRRRTESPLERRVLAVLDELPVPPFACQHWLSGASGKRYRADFAWPELGVILEADGRSVHERQQAMDDDRARDGDLLAAGVRTLRVTSAQLNRGRAAFVASLLGTLQQGV